VEEQQQAQQKALKAKILKEYNEMTDDEGFFTRKTTPFFTLGLGVIAGLLVSKFIIKKGKK
jgi:hypothetical protein